MLCRMARMNVVSCGILSFADGMRVNAGRLWSVNSIRQTSTAVVVVLSVVPRSRASKRGTAVDVVQLRSTVIGS